MVPYSWHTLYIFARIKFIEFILTQTFTFVTIFRSYFSYLFLKYYEYFIFEYEHFKCEYIYFAIFHMSFLFVYVYFVLDDIYFHKKSLLNEDMFFLVLFYVNLILCRNIIFNKWFSFSYLYFLLVHSITLKFHKESAACMRFQHFNSYQRT